MKIALALDDTLDVSDGVQQAVITIGENLRSMGHDVHYLASETTRNDLDNVHSLARTFKVAFNGNVMRIPKPASRDKIKRLLHSENFDVIHVQMPYSPLFVERVILNSPKNTKLFGTFHILPYSSVNRYATHILGKILRRSIRKLDVVISVSEPARDFCKKTFGVDSKVIPNPVDISKFKFAKKSVNYKKRIVFLGRLVERKGAKQLILAYKKMLESHPDLIDKTELVIGGKGEQESTLKNIAKSLPGGAQISFIGFVDELDKPNLLASADIAVFPSLGGESFGIVLIEAMAAQSRMILAGDNPGYNSVMGKFPELLVSPNQYDNFAEKMYQLLQDNDNNKQLSKKLHQEAINYDVKAVCKSLLDLYQS